MKKPLQKITILKGDGIGPEVIDQAIHVLEAIAQVYKHTFEYDDQLIGAVAIDATGSPLPEQTLKSCKESHAILMGAIGHPKYDNNPKLEIRPELGLLGLRKELGLFANVRPIKIFKNLKFLSVLKPSVLDNVDMLIFRELTGGIYFGDKQRSANSASDLCIYHDYEIERIAKLAFEAALKRKKKLCLVDKANVLESSRLWRDVVMKMSKNYPQIKVEYMFVDNASMQLIINPSRFDVILTSNMFGDIISDEASVLGGSLGMLPSSSTGNSYSLYEPVHGSYPQAAGKDIANPLAAILSVEMMLRDFGYVEEADQVLYAVERCIDNGVLTEDLNTKVPRKCSEVGIEVCIYIKESKAHEYGVII